MSLDVNGACSVSGIALLNTGNDATDPDPPAFEDPSGYTIGTTQLQALGAWMLHVRLRLDGLVI